MRITGLTHLEAVSGENLTIVLGVVTASGSRRRVAAPEPRVVAAVAVVAFVWLARHRERPARGGDERGGAVGEFAGRRTSALPTLRSR